MAIFEGGGITKQTGPGTQGTAFITIALPNKGTITGSAPVMGVTIQQSVDYNITKALNKDFLLASFGDQPVTISIKGFTIIPTGCITDEDSEQSLLNLYQTAKASAEQKPRCTVSITIQKHSQVFTCAMVSMLLQMAEQASVSGIGAYMLEFVGVAK